MTNKIDFEEYKKFIKSLNLVSIQPLSFHSDRFGAFSLEDGALELCTRLGFRDNDPETLEENRCVFQVEMFFGIKTTGNIKLFEQVSSFRIIFDVLEKDVFERGLQDSDIKDFFLQKQLKKILWPIFRQNVLDGMTRLCLPGIALPFEL